MRTGLLLVSIFAAGIVSTAMPIGAFAQNNTQAFDVVKGPKSESFSLPFAAANQFESKPFVYTYDSPKGQNWILGISNNVTYTDSNDSKVIVKLQEPAPSPKYIEITMYGGQKHSYYVAVNGADNSYSVIYSMDDQGWSTDDQISVSHADNQGLTVTDGKRIVVDRLDIQGFNIGSIAVYGKQNRTDPVNAVGGQMSFEILYGDPSDSPTYFVPLAIMIGMGGLMGVLLIFKKRKPGRWT